MLDLVSCFSEQVVGPPWVSVLFLWKLGMPVKGHAVPLH